jgi:3-hydroxyacyl-CoA dehydrogenase
MADHEIVSTERRGAVGLVLVDRPPVNAIDASVRAGLIEGVSKLAKDDNVKAIVLACRGRTFLSGADIREFGGEIGEPGYRRVMTALENCPKPIVAALHGTALGGGLETAMACHYRVAVASARVGLPEITLGVLPGSGGTQRLPRLIGARAALEIVLSGTPITAQRALELGVLDAVGEGDAIELGVDFAKQLIEHGEGPRPTCARRVDAAGFDNAAIADVLRVNAKALRGRTTQHAMVQAIQAAVNEPDFERGLDLETDLAEAAVASRESRALVHAFFSERAVSKIPGLSPDVAVLPITRVAVIGAGTMGSGIAMAFNDSGFDVTLIDASEQGLQRGVSIIQSTYEGAAKRGRSTPDDAQRAIARVGATLDLTAMANADLIVEAVFEDTDLKRKVLADIDRLAPSHAIITTNTSSLSVDALAGATARPDKVIGLHFFSPAHVMRLLEIVRGASTSQQVLLTGIDVARRIKKVGVVSGDGFGFIGNRMMLDGYFREAEQLMLEGAEPAQVDAAMEAFGFAMGPGRVNDMGGVDIGTLVRQQLFKRQTRPDPYCVVSDALTAMGRLGQKTGKGFYNYADDPRLGKPDPEVTALIASLAKERGIRQRAITDEEIVERCVLQLVNVGADILADGIAYRAGDIDVVWLLGYGFPRHLGGPMFYADDLGLRHVLERVRSYQDRHAAYWKPSRLLVDLAERGKTFASYQGSGAG